MSNLVSYTKLSPNHYGKRNHVIDTFTIHTMAGNMSVESCGSWFAKSSTGASSNYGIGSDGRIAMYVPEDCAAWCSSDYSNDNRAITIEVASTTNKEPFAVTNAAYESLINLLVDCCKRHGIKKLLWRGDKSLIGKIDKQNMTVHRWFANKACPGSWLYERHGAIAEEVNKRLEEANKVPEEDGEEMVVRYKRLKDIPNGNGFRDIVEKLMDAGILGGDGSDPHGNDDIIDLSHDMVRTIVLNYRGGAYDRRLIAAGLEPSVE